MFDSETVLIVGAGFSCEAGLPDTKMVAESFLESPPDGELDARIEDEISHQLARFWRYAFRYLGNGPLPLLEDHFTVLDLAANMGRNIGPDYTPRKLRAIRRLSIHRIFQILNRYRHSRAIDGLLVSIQPHPPVAIISTNWDIVIENHMSQLRMPFWYGLPTEDLRGEPAGAEGTKLLMLHGSANWIYCDCCRRLYVGQSGDGKAALRAQIYIHRDDFEILCPDKTMVLDLVSRSPRAPKKCIHCESRLSARIATFSYRKEVAIPQFQAVWQQAYSALRDCDSWLFVGYSLPEADFEFRHLLKSAEKSVRGHRTKTIRAILKKDVGAGRRFRRFFGIPEEGIHQRGLSEFMKGQ